MALHYITPGFVFKKEDRLDADRIFSVFTRDFGRVEIFAKAVRKIASKLKSGIEVFYVSDMEFIQGKNRKTLTDAALLRKYKNIEQDPEKFVVAQNIAKILDSFIKGQELDEIMWEFLLDIFAKLDDVSTNNKFLYYYFFWNFVDILGYKPEVTVCVHCNEALRPEKLYFSSKEGGIMCKKCFVGKPDTIEISADAIKVLRLILKKDWELLGKLKVQLYSKKVFKEVSNHYLEYLVSDHSFGKTYGNI